MPNEEPAEIYQMTFDPYEEEGTRKIKGCASVPVPDRENEIVTREAIEAALPAFMELPVLHYWHSERPVGWVDKAYFDDEDRFHVEGRIKSTPDCDDIWDRIKSGEITQFSIFGRRREGNAFCRLDPEHRRQPCETSSLFLDSISVCPDTTAQNQQTYLEIAKAQPEGIAEETPSDTILKSDRAEEQPMTDTEAESAPSGDNDVLQKLLDGMQQVVSTVQDLSTRLEAVEDSLGTHEEPDGDETGGEEPEETDEVEKGDEYPDDGYDDGPDEDSDEEDYEDDEEYPDDGYEDEPDDDDPELTATFAEALHSILTNQQEILARLPKAAPESDNQVSKCSIKKAEESRVDLQAQIDEIRDILSKATKPGLAPIIISQDEIKKSSENSEIDVNSPAALNYAAFGGL